MTAVHDTCVIPDVDTSAPALVPPSTPSGRRSGQTRKRRLTDAALAELTRPAESPVAGAYQLPGGPPAGRALRHSSGAVIVAACHADGSPPDPRFPCWVVIWGSHLLGRRAWLHASEVVSIGGWEDAGNILELVEQQAFPLLSVAANPLVDASEDIGSGG